jgi:hypothetical protein
VLSFLLRYTDSDCSFGIFKLFNWNHTIPCPTSLSYYNLLWLGCLLITLHRQLIRVHGD